MTFREELEKKKLEIAEFPEEFKLKTFPGDGPFRIDPNPMVHFDDQLIVQVKRGDQWLDFSRGTKEEIKGYIK